MVDIRGDTLRREDIFWVDTNVWLWQTYTHSVASNQNDLARINTYTSYLAHGSIILKIHTWSSHPVSA